MSTKIAADIAATTTSCSRAISAQDNLSRTGNPRIVFKIALFVDIAANENLFGAVWNAAHAQKPFHPLVKAFLRDYCHGV